ncbi:MAG: SDR family NAD(P)-dependent oxidoreductase [Acetobacteraceae bacterium]
MDLDLSGRTALVSGSTAGIGLATASGLAKQGAEVWVNGRTRSRVDSAIATVIAAFPNARLHGVAADLATADGAADVARVVPALDILVNNLGGVGARKPFDELDDADWRHVFALNVLSGVRLARQYLPGMRARNWGRIIFVSSESALQIPSEFPHYGAAKAAVIAVARGVAETLVGTGVTVNSVLPGPTLAEGFSRRIAADGRSVEEFSRDFFEQSRPTSLIRRLAEPEEVANMIVYLCTPAASATHGAALRVDGGVVKSAF